MATVVVKRRAYESGENAEGRLYMQLVRRWSFLASRPGCVQISSTSPISITRSAGMWK